MLGKDLDRIVKKQLGELRPPPAPAAEDAVSEDFITKGLELANLRGHYRTQFDLWFTVEGATLEDKKAKMLQQAGALAKEIADLKAKVPPDDAAIRRRSRTRDGLLALANKSDDELGYVFEAVNFQRQRANLDRQLDILLEQIRLMHRVHGVVNQYLQIDATIDGAKIAEAASAGSNVDLGKYPDLTGIVGALGAGKGAP
jgi:hypothetical protein